ncbi:MAG: hypothetical protein Q9207_005630 [Kuettlingeria erythrocarpa]
MSSFLPTVTGAHVCLRCRLRLANGRARPRRSLHLSVQAQPLQEIVRLHNTLANEQSLVDNPTSFSVKATHKEDDIKLPNDAKPKQVSKDSGVFFKRANLYSKKALGVTTLGKPAEVLRVRDAPRPILGRMWFLPQKEDDRSPYSAETMTSADIFQRVASERGFISAESAKANIEAVKQEWLTGRDEPDRKPSESECYELRRKLYDGFTNKQLLAYFNEAKLPLSADLDDISRPHRSPLLIRSEWRAGITPFPGDTFHRLQPFDADPKGANSGSHEKTYTIHMLSHEGRHSKDPNKNIIVNKILRQCWNIAPKEELEIVGEVDVCMPETHLELITSHAKDVLRQVAYEYDVKIDFLKVVPVLRITSTQLPCVSTLKLISMVLDEIVCCELSLGSKGDSSLKSTAIRTQLNDRLLREIERLSGAVIRWPKRRGASEGNDDKLLVYSLRNRNKSLEDAQKFISQALRPDKAAVVGSFSAKAQAVTETLVPVPVEVGQSIPLADRGTAWIRRVSTSGKRLTNGQDSPTTYQTLPALRSIQDYIQTSDAWEKFNTKSPEYAFWWPDVHQETSVIPGRLLYPAEDATRGIDGAPLYNITAARRVFSSELPSLRWSLDAQEPSMNAREELYVTLSAVTQQGSDGLEKARIPDLELRFTQDSTFSTPLSNESRPEDTAAFKRKATLKTVRLILERKEADLSLPHEQADVRFEHRIYINGKAGSDPSIESFTRASVLDRADVDRIETPQLLTVRIPRQFLFPGRDLEESEDSEVAIDYSPTGIERRYSLRNRPGLNARKRLSNLTYSTIDAGLIGGRRQEIRFSSLSPDRAVRSGSAPVKGKKGTTDDSKLTLRTLYKSALNMIHSLGTESRVAAKQTLQNSRSRRRIVEVLQGHRGTPFGREFLANRHGSYVPRRPSILPQYRFSGVKGKRGEVGARKVRTTPIHRVSSDRSTRIHRVGVGRCRSLDVNPKRKGREGRMARISRVRRVRVGLHNKPNA